MSRSWRAGRRVRIRNKRSSIGPSLARGQFEDAFGARWRRVGLRNSGLELPGRSTSFQPRMRHGRPPRELLSGRAILTLVLASRRPAATLQGRHPGWRTTAALPATPGQSFQCQNRFFHLFSFLAQVRQHFKDIHKSFSPSPQGAVTKFVRSRNGTGRSGLPLSRPFDFRTVSREFQAFCSKNGTRSTFSPGLPAGTKPGRDPARILFQRLQ